MSFISPYAIFGTNAIWASISALAFRLRPRRVLCELANTHGALHYQPRQPSSQDRSFAICSRCGHSRHYSDESRDNRAPEWYTVLAGGIVWTKGSTGQFRSHLAWYEGAVMAFSPGEAAAAFARERRLPSASRVLVKGYTIRCGTELFTVGRDIQS